MTPREIRQMADMVEEMKKMKAVFETWDDSLKSAQMGARRAAEIESLTFRGYTHIIEEIPA